MWHPDCCEAFKSLHSPFLGRAQVDSRPAAPLAKRRKPELSWKWERGLAKVPYAKLIVEPKRWRVEAYFPGPDQRYRGTSWRLELPNVDRFAQALRDAWHKLEQLECEAPSRGEFVAHAAMNIQIMVRSHRGRGITVHQHYGLIKSHDGVEQAATELESLAEEAAMVQAKFR